MPVVTLPNHIKTVWLHSYFRTFYYVSLLSTFPYLSELILCWPISSRKIAPIKKKFFCPTKYGPKLFITSFNVVLIRRFNLLSWHFLQLYQNNSILFASVTRTTVISLPWFQEHCFKRIMRITDICNAWFMHTRKDVNGTNIPAHLLQWMVICIALSLLLRMDVNEISILVQ